MKALCRYSPCKRSKPRILLWKRKATQRWRLASFSGVPFRGIARLIQGVSSAAGTRFKSLTDSAGLSFKWPVRGGAPEFKRAYPSGRARLISALWVGLLLARIGPALGQTLTASAGADREICAGSSVAIGGSPTASGGTPGYTYKWSPAAGLNGTQTAANPTATPDHTTVYTVTVTDANSDTASDSVTVTVDPPPVGGTALASASTVCVNTGTTITLSGEIGGIEKWQSSTDNWATTNEIASVANPLATGTLTVNTRFRAVVTNGVCGAVDSSDTAVSVDAMAVGGTVTAAAPTVCYNSGTTITLSGQTGGIEKWQSSTDNWATTNEIASVANPLATGNLTVNTRFRAVVTNGVCGAVDSSDAAVSVDAMAVGGTATAAASDGLLQQRHDDHAERTNGWDREVAVVDG